MKTPTILTIRHKNNEINREGFKVGDEIILSNEEGYELEFKIGKIGIKF